VDESYLLEHWNLTAPVMFFERLQKEYPDLFTTHQQNIERINHLFKCWQREARFASPSETEH